MSVDITKIKFLIVDDEKEACINLRNMLIEYVNPGLYIAGIANSTHEAEQQIAKIEPDAIFLDIEMPKENAFQFLERMSPFKFEVIFVTAYDEYAIKAFKLNAVDYILKPISIAELQHAVQKLQQRLNVKKFLSNGGSFAEIANQIKNKIKQHRITLRDNNNIDVIDFKDICFVEAQGSYSRIVFLKNGEVKEITMSNSISEYEELLPTDHFYRVHRSYLINCAHVKKIIKEDAHYIVINETATIPVSRRRYLPLLEFLKNNEYYAK